MRISSRVEVLFEKRQHTRTGRGNFTELAKFHEKMKFFPQENHENVFAKETATREEGGAFVNFSPPSCKS